MAHTAQSQSRRSRAAKRTTTLANRAARRIRRAAQNWDAWAEAQVAKFEAEMMEADQVHGLMVGGYAYGGRA